MKKIGIIINDVHLKSDNIEQVLDLINQAKEYCKKEKIETIYFAGDIVDSRSSLRMDVLQALLKIRQTIIDTNLNMCSIAGNHDCTRYDSADSWLDVWVDKTDNRIGGMSMMVREYKPIVHGDVAIHMLSHFRDDILIPMIEDIKPIENKTNILISHFAVGHCYNSRPC